MVLIMTRRNSLRRKTTQSEKRNHTNRLVESASKDPAVKRVLDSNALRRKLMSPEFRELLASKEFGRAMTFPEFRNILATGNLTKIKSFIRQQQKTKKQ
jgi:hypothetical protein